MCTYSLFKRVTKRKESREGRACICWFIFPNAAAATAGPGLSQGPEEPMVAAVLAKWCMPISDANSTVSGLTAMLQCHPLYIFFVNFFVLSSDYGHLGWFYILTLVNRAAMNMMMQKFLWYNIFMSSRYTPSSMICGSCGKSSSSCLCVCVCVCFKYINKI